MNLPDQLLLGTTNQNKIREFKEFLAPYFKSIISLSDLTESYPEPIESGSTFHENAQIKADYYCLKTGLATLSDDSGICIPALDNWPNVLTKRFGQQFETLTQCYEAIEKKLTNLDYTVFFSCALVLRFPQEHNNAKIGGHSVTASGRIKGQLTFPGRGQGFDADPIFIPDGATQTFAENPALKNQHSHRIIALQNLLTALKS